MKSDYMLSLAFILFGVGLIILASIVKYGKNTSFISALNEKRLKRIKKLDVLLNAYAKSLMLISVGCFTAAILINFSKVFGMIAGMIIILAGAVSLNSVTDNIDEKIKKGIY